MKAKPLDKIIYLSQQYAADWVSYAPGFKNRRSDANYGVLLKDATNKFNGFFSKQDDILIRVDAVNASLWEGFRDED